MKRSRTLLLTVVSLGFIQGICQGTAEPETVTISVDPLKETGTINKAIAGRYTQRMPEWLDAIPATFIREGHGSGAWAKLNPWIAEGEYDWSKLDALMGSYVDRGIQVLLPIAFTPEWLWSEEATNEQAPGIFTYMKKGNTLPPDDYQKWETLIYDTVRHLNVDKKFGVIIEFWNEPDMDWFWNGTQEQLIELYEHTARAVKRADPETLIGGPGLTHARRDWLEPFIQHCAEHEVPLDFISWHGYFVYALWDNARQLAMETNPEEAKEWSTMIWQGPVLLSYTEQVAMVREIIARYPSIGEPMLINSEWGYSWNMKEKDEAIVSMSPYHAAYVAQSMFEMLESGMYAATFCSYMGPVEDPWPVYQSFNMFGMLEPTRISTSIKNEGAGINVLASKSEESMTIMLWNLPSPIPVLEGESRRSPGGEEGRSSPFRQPSPADKTLTPVTLILENLCPGNYTYTRYLVDKDHSGKDLVKVANEQVHIDNRKELKFTMMPNSVSLIEFTKTTTPEAI